MLIGAKFKDNKSFKQKFYRLYNNSYYYTPNVKMISSNRLLDFHSRPYPHVWMLLESKPLEFLLNIFEFEKPCTEWWSERGVIIKYERNFFLWNNEHINVYTRVRDEWEDSGTEIWDISKFSSNSLKDISKW